VRRLRAQPPLHFRVENMLAVESLQWVRGAREELSMVDHRYMIEIRCFTLSYIWLVSNLEIEYIAEIYISRTQ
jgi:hypothetical protein